MRHHQRSQNFNRQNLALLLDPFANAAVSSASNPNYIDHQNMLGLGLNEATIVDQEEPIFVPHREKVRKKNPYFLFMFIFDRSRNWILFFLV